jgi:hypothetical protein
MIGMVRELNLDLYDMEYKVGDILILREVIDDIKLYKTELGKEQVIVEIRKNGFLHTRFRNSLLSHYLHPDGTYVKCCEHRRDLISKWVPQLKII